MTFDNRAVIIWISSSDQTKPPKSRHKATRRTRHVKALFVLFEKDVEDNPCSCLSGMSGRSRAELRSINVVSRVLPPTNKLLMQTRRNTRPSLESLLLALSILFLVRVPPSSAYRLRVTRPNNLINVIVIGSANKGNCFRVCSRYSVYTFGESFLNTRLFVVHLVCERIGRLWMITLLGLNYSTMFVFTLFFTVQRYLVSFRIFLYWISVL